VAESQEQELLAVWGLWWFDITLQGFLSCLWRNSYELQTSILRKQALISVISVHRQESTRGLGMQLGQPIMVSYCYQIALNEIVHFAIW